MHTNRPKGTKRPPPPPPPPCRMIINHKTVEQETPLMPQSIDRPPSRTNEEKLLYMFHAIHGEFSSSFTIECVYDDFDNSVCGIDVKKDGSLCWHDSKIDILFDYVTRDM